jgi:hypothetical protein
MASGAMVHPCEFFLFCILQRMWLGNNAVCPEKFFSPPKEQDPIFNLGSLMNCAEPFKQLIRKCNKNDVFSNFRSKDNYERVYPMKRSACRVFGTTHSFLHLDI